MQAMIENYVGGAMFLVTANSLVMLATCMLVGVIGRILKILSDEADFVISNLLIRFALPATILLAMMQPFSTGLLINSIATILIMCVIFLFGWAVGTGISFAVKANSEERRIWQFALMFPNVTYIGLPVISAIYGEAGMMYASMVTMAFFIMVFSFGVRILKPLKVDDGTNDKQSSSVAFIPVAVSLLLGFIFFVTSARLPAPIENGIELIGGMTAPLAMILVGSVLAKTIGETGIKSLIKDWRVYVVVLARLVLIPVVAFIALNPFLENQIMLGTVVILSAMPVAALTVIILKQFNAKTSLASRTIVLSDVLCLVTIPILSVLL